MTSKQVKGGVLLVAGLLMAPALSGCDDKPPPPPAKKGSPKATEDGEGGAKPPPAAGGGAATAGGGNQLKINSKIPEQYRRELKERDFRPDPLGEENRDPFFSYVLENPRLPVAVSANALKDNCADREWRGQHYSVRSMKLVAIVLQGTRSWAQFIDPDSLGQIVERGFCLGKEKAIVDHIGDNFVRVKMTPEAPPGAATPEPVLEDFSLYPAEMDLKEAKD